MSQRVRLILPKPALALVSAALLAACSDPSAPSSAAPPSPAPQSVRPQSVPPQSVPSQRPVPQKSVPPRPAPSADRLPPLPPLARQINLAALPPPVPTALASPRASFDPVLVRAQVLLDRARFSPGAIDGRNGGNFGAALRAWQGAHGLAPTGALDPAAFAALARNDGGPAVRLYVITPRDEAGPFIGRLPHGFKAQAKLPVLGFLGPVQELAERFHMSPRLLRALNPNADFGRAGTSILVTIPNPAPLPAPVGRIEVDKSRRAVRAYDPGGGLLAVFPASVGSRERPAPSGVLKVRGVARRPKYVWDPKRVSFGPRHAHRLTVAPGPNNPVGVVWIALSQRSYGIHGAPDPDSIGKRQSHGCIRLTNWDAELLGRAVRPGVEVLFVGQDTSARAM